jgi:hypothetical protein
VKKLGIWKRREQGPEDDELMLKLVDLASL